MGRYAPEVLVKWMEVLLGVVLCVMDRQDLGCHSSSELSQQ